MKKITLFALAFSAFTLQSAFAAGVAVPDSGAITTNATTGCGLLSEGVTVNLTTNVSAAFNCDVATNTITVGTCHSAGSRLPSLKCAQIGTDNSGAEPAPIYNHNDCNAQMVTDGESIEGAPDFRGFFAQTSGGSLAPAFLGGNCTSAVLVGHDKLGK